MCLARGCSFKELRFGDLSIILLVNSKLIVRFFHGSISPDAIKALVYINEFMFIFPKVFLFIMRCFQQHRLGMNVLVAQIKVWVHMF